MTRLVYSWIAGLCLLGVVQLMLPHAEWWRALGVVALLAVAMTCVYLGLDAAYAATREENDER